MATTVSLVGGPANGETRAIDDPWPRSFLIVLKSGLYLRYWVRDGTTIADYQDPNSVPAEADVLTENQGPPGDPGGEGPPGDKGDKGDPGVPIVWKGPYDSTQLYLQYQATYYQGGSYYVYTATAPSAGTVPTNATYWAT